MTTNILEQARDLARSGDHANLSSVAKALVRRGFARVEVDGHLFGKTIRIELRTLCREARLTQGASSR